MPNATMALLLLLPLQGWHVYVFRIRIGSVSVAFPLTRTNGPPHRIASVWFGLVAIHSFIRQKITGTPHHTISHHTK